MSDFDAQLPVRAIATEFTTEVADSAGATINPAKEDGNLASIKSDTDTLAGAVTSSKFQDNLAQVAGTATSVNNGTVDAGTLRVTVASDSTGQVKLATGSNQIGHLEANQSISLAQIAGSAIATAATGIMKIGLTDGSGTAITSTSSALDVNIKSNASSNNSVNVAQIAGNTTVTGGANGLLAVAGDTASGSSDANNPVKIGHIGRTTLPTAVSDGQRVNSIADKFGRVVSVLGTVRDLRGTQTTTISNSTSETTIVTAGATGVFNDIIMLLVSNTSASTNTRIDFRDVTGNTVIFSLQSPANQTVGFAVPGTSIPQTTAANNWTAQCGTATTDIRIWAVFEKNK